MAIRDIYVDSNVEDGKVTNNYKIQGAHSFILQKTFEIDASDSDGSIYRFCRIPADAVITSISMLSDAIAGFIDAEVGLFEAKRVGLGGAVIDQDIFMGSTDINAGNARGSERNCMTAVAIEDAEKRIYELAGQTLDTRKLGYDIALVGNDIGSAGGTVTMIVEWIQG